MIHIWKKRPLFTVCLLFFCLGFIAAHVWGVYFLPGLMDSPAETSIPPDTDVYISGQVYRIEEKEAYQVLYLKNNSIFIQTDQTTSISPASDRVREPRILLYDSQKIKVKPGNEITAGGSLFFFDEARNPGNFDQKFYYQKQNIHAGVWAERTKTADEEYWPVRSLLADFRAGWKTMLYKAAGEKNGGILCAMILGDKAGMDGGIKELYQRNGIAHVLAISGLHLSFIGAGVYHFWRKRTGSFVLGGVLGLSFLLLYILMIGLTVSALRALVMLCIRVGADMCGRAYDLLTSLSVAAVIIICWRPLSYYDGGFQMSFGAILGIWIVGELFRISRENRGKLVREAKETGRLGRVKDRFCQSLLASVGVQSIIFPVTLYHYFEFPTYSVFLNLLVIPLMSALLFLGMAGSLCCFVCWPLGKCCIYICGVILKTYEGACRLQERLLFSRLMTGQPEMGEIVFYYLCLGLTVFLWQNRTYLRGKGAGVKWLVPVGAGVLALLLTGNVSRLSGLEAAVLDVGQGDCIYIQKGGVTILADGGSSDVKKVGQYRIEPFLKARGRSKIDYIFVTHGDADHINGIEELLARQKEGGIPVGRLVLPKESWWDEKLEALAKTAAFYGTKVAVIEKGQSLAWGKLELTCLHPGEAYTGEAGNGASMVLSLDYGNFDMLLTGDVEGEGETLLTKEVNKSFDMLKAAHHGSKNSTSSVFLEKVRPAVAVISAGQENRYGHPHKETLKRLKDKGCYILRTDRQGAVMIRTDGKRQKIRTFL